MKIRFRTRSLPPSGPNEIQTIEPASNWALSQTGEGALGTGGAIPTVNLLPLTDGGIGYPAEPSWRANINDWFYIPEDDNGYLLFIHHNIGNSAGWSPTVFTLEGNSVSVNPGLYTINGRTFFGSAIRVRGLDIANRWGWANLTWRIRPKRGFEAIHTVRVWLNRNQKVVRTQLWVDPVNGSDSNSGTTQISAFRNLGKALGYGFADTTRLGPGYHINLMAGTHTNPRGDFTAELMNEGPITIDLAPGVAKTDVCITNTTSSAPDTIEFNQQRVSVFNTRFALYLVKGFSAPRTKPGVANGKRLNGTTGPGTGGHFYFRDGCDLRDARDNTDFATARAGGPYEFGVMEGFAKPADTSPARSFRFWNPADSHYVSMIGSLTNPISIRLSHAFSGIQSGFACTGEFAWSGMFFTGDGNYSNTGLLACDLTAHGQFWGRKHTSTWLTVTGPITSETLSGSWGSLTMWKVPIDSTGQNMDSYPPLNGKPTLASGGDPAIRYASSEFGQVWARCRNGATNCKANPLPGWGSGRTPNEAGIYIDGIGPPLYLNRQGQSSYESSTTDFGFCVLGWDTSFVYLLNDPGAITHLSVVTGHGAHSIFVQGAAGNAHLANGPLLNFVVAYSSIEHPENYIQMQHNGDVQTGSGTISIDADGLCTHSAQTTTIRKGHSIRLTSAGSGTNNSGKIFVVRHVVSATQCYVYTDTVSTTGVVSANLSGTVTGATFDILRGGILGFDLTRSFIWGNAATGWNGSIYGLIIDSSTIHQMTKFGTPPIIDLRSALYQRWSVGRITESYLSGWNISDVSPTVHATGNQHGMATSLDTSGGVVSSPGSAPSYGFAASRKGNVTHLRTTSSIDRLGNTATAGVHVVGSDVA